MILGNEIRIEKEPLPPALLNRLIRLAAFPNPEFDKAAGNASFDPREAAIRELCPGLSPPHRIAARLP